MVKLNFPRSSMASNRWRLAAARAAAQASMLLLLIGLATAAHAGVGNYANVNGLKLYYETYGNGRPLVLLHGGGSTIDSTFGQVLPQLARRHRVIAVESQAHGHTPDIDRPPSFEQDADDVAALLNLLHVREADVIGFSNGGMIALQLAIRHQDRVGKLVLISTPFKREGMVDGFWQGLENAKFDSMPKQLKDAFLKANSDSDALRAMFNRDRTRMLGFKGFDESQIHAITSPALVVNGDADVVRTEHALALARLLPKAHLAIIPGGHGEPIGEVMFRNPEGKAPALALPIIEQFLDESK